VSHEEFVAAYGRGEAKVEIDPKQAARTLSARLVLPFLVMPVLGIGVALALIGWVYTGLAVIAVGVVAPRLIKRTAPHFLLQQTLQDEAVYSEVTQTGLLRVTSVASDK